MDPCGIIFSVISTDLISLFKVMSKWSRVQFLYKFVSWNFHAVVFLPNFIYEIIFIVVFPFFL